MKILDRYILVNFIKPFIYALVAFTGILVLTEWLGMIALLVHKKTPALVVLEYLSLRIPSIFVEITPCAILLAVLYSFNELIQRGEIAAMRAAGLSINRISLPILIFASGMSILFFLFTGFVGPRFNAWAYEVMQRKIENIPPITKMYGISLVSQDNRIYHFGVFDKELGLIRSLTIIEAEKGNPPRLRIDAQSAQWQDGNWYLYNGIIRRFDQNGEEGSPERFEERRGEIKESLDELWKALILKEKRSEDMTIFELWEGINLLRISGVRYKDRLTDLHFRFSSSLVNLVMVFIGVSLASFWDHKPRGKMSGFGLAIMVIFLYWGITAVSRSLGHVGAIPPIIAAWITNILFFVPAVLLWSRG